MHLISSELSVVCAGFANNKFAVKLKHCQGRLSLVRCVTVSVQFLLSPHLVLVVWEHQLVEASVGLGKKVGLILK